MSIEASNGLNSGGLAARNISTSTCIAGLARLLLSLLLLLQLLLLLLLLLLVLLQLLLGRRSGRRQTVAAGQTRVRRVVAYDGRINKSRNQ